MPLYALANREPTIHPTAFVHPDAVLIGGVHIGEMASVWPCAVLRADTADIHVGARTSIQDGSVIHVGGLTPTLIGDDCVIGHLVHMEGCVIESGTLIGSNSVVLPGAIVRTGAIVAAGAVVSAGAEVPSGALAVGIPAKFKLDAAKADVISSAAQAYVDRVPMYVDSLRRIS
ncbi:MAG: gamma carbonic anhydrase family protein [Acidimicrobiia bacterium]